MNPGEEVLRYLMERTETCQTFELRLTLKKKKASNAICPKNVLLCGSQPWTVDKKCQEDF